MSKISFFDSLTHPTLDSKWIGGRKGGGFEELSRNMKSLGLRGVCAVGLPGVGSYSHKKFFSECSKYPGFYPVAALTKATTKAALNEIDEIARLGYRAVKIHPRLLGRFFTESEFVKILKACHGRKLIVFYCTYYHQPLGNFPTSDPFWTLVGCLNKVPEIKMILMHGGSVRLLEYAELCRFNSNLLLDLSHTLMKYRNSSIEADVEFLFRNFDQRVCVGTDHPEWKHKDVATLLQKKLSKLSAEKKANILYKNLEKFLAI